MFLHFSIFVFFASVSADQFSDINEFLKQHFKIELDEKCISDKIGFYFFDKFVKNLNFCITDIHHLSNSQNPAVDDEKLIATFCESSSPTYCAPIVLQALKKCLIDTQINHLKYKIASDDAIKNYACANNAQALRDYYNMDKRTCSNYDVQTQSMKCHELILPLTDVKIEDMFEKDTCLLLEKSVQCMANAFKSCKDKSMYRFILESNHAGLQATPCKQYLNGSNLLIDINPGLIAIILCYSLFRNLGFLQFLQY